jgi:hypothetical protein
LFPQKLLRSADPNTYRKDDCCTIHSLLRRHRSTGPCTLTHLPRSTRYIFHTTPTHHFISHLYGPVACAERALRLAALTAPALHARVHRATLRRLSGSYAALYAHVCEPRSQYADAEMLLGAERPFGSNQTRTHRRAYGYS